MKNTLFIGLTLLLTQTTLFAQQAPHSIECNLHIQRSSKQRTVSSRPSKTIIHYQQQLQLDAQAGSKVKIKDGYSGIELGFEVDQNEKTGLISFTKNNESKSKKIHIDDEYINLEHYKINHHFKLKGSRKIDINYHTLTINGHCLLI